VKALLRRVRAFCDFVTSEIKAFRSLLVGQAVPEQSSPEFVRRGIS